MAAKKDVVTKHYAYYFPIFLFITQMAGILFMAFIFITVVLYLGGYDYIYETKRGRNFHMILAPLTFVYMNGQGMLLFRLMKNVKTQTVKVIHSLVHTASLLLGILAIYAMWNGKESPYTAYTAYQNTPTAFPRPTKYTPVPIGEIEHFAGFHSYLGYLTLLVFFCAFFVGVFLHLLEVDMFYKDAFSGVHGFLGTLTLVVGTIASVCGVVTVYNDKDYFWFTRYTKYYSEYKIGFYCSCFGLTFSWVILYLVLNPHFEWMPVGPV